MVAATIGKAVNITVEAIIGERKSSIKISLAAKRVIAMLYFGTPAPSEC